MSSTPPPRSVIATLPVGQDPQALVYVARSRSGGTAGLTDQGLGQRIESYPLTGLPSGASGQSTVRNLPELDEVDVTARGLAPDTTYDVFAIRGETRIKIRTATTDETGTVAEALAFVEFFDNDYEAVQISPATE